MRERERKKRGSLSSVVGEKAKSLYVENSIAQILRKMSMKNSSMSLIIERHISLLLMNHYSDKLFVQMEVMVAIRMFPMDGEADQQDVSLNGQDFLKRKGTSGLKGEMKFIDHTVRREKFVVEYVNMNEIVDEIV